MSGLTECALKSFKRMPILVGVVDRQAGQGNSRTCFSPNRCSCSFFCPASMRFICC
ncbi:protein of unknown function [Rhodovastum atsumiense]|nr:protein of unknown function [Rhodovastum atsumiense]